MRQWTNIVRFGRSTDLAKIRCLPVQVALSHAKHDEL
jgi:hypothetical protein